MRIASVVKKYYERKLLNNSPLSNCFNKYKMNKIVNKFLLTGDRFIAELHLRQPRFTYSACQPFTKHCVRIQKFREAGNTKFF